MNRGTMPQVLALFAVLVLVGLVSMLLPTLVDTGLDGGRVTTWCWCFVLVQLPAAGGIVAWAMPDRRRIARLLAVLALGWSIWCAAVAGMAYSGVWL